RATMAWARRASAGQRSPVSARRTPATYSSIGNSLITARPLPWRMISSGATYSRPLSRSERSLVSRKAAAARPSISTAVAVAAAYIDVAGQPADPRHPPREHQHDANHRDDGADDDEGSANIRHGVTRRDRPARLAWRAVASPNAGMPHGSPADPSACARRSR